MSDRGVTAKAGRARFTARRETVRDQMDRRRMAFKIRDLAPGPDDPVLDAELWTFLGLCCQSESHGLAFTLPTAADSGETIMLAFQSYLELPGTTANIWKEAVARANEPLNEEADPNE